MVKMRKPHLADRKGRWLHKAAKAMRKVTLQDWEIWRRKRMSRPA